jgi:hypothetical protein
MMEEKVIELFKLAGYEYLTKKYDGRLEFYDVEFEETVCFLPVGLSNAMEFIKGRCYGVGKSIGRSYIQSEIKKLLDL